MQPNPVVRPELDNPVPEIRRSTRVRRTPDRYGDWDYSFGEEGLIVNSNNNIEPRSLFEAINSSESSEWKLAMERELKAFDKHQVFELVKRTPDMNVIKSKWVFKKKKGSDGNVVSYKARLVAQGFLQRPGIDYDEVFAPVSYTHLTLPTNREV